MADVQKENGYTQIADELLEALYQIPLSPTEFRVFLYILRKTYGFKKKQDWISQKQIAKEFEIHKQHISRTIKRLKRKNMITNNIEKNKKILGIQKDYEKWELPELVTKRLSKLVTNKKKLPKSVTKVTRNGYQKLPKLAHTKETLTKETLTKDIYSTFYDKVISYLNEKADKKYKVILAHTKFISARIKEGGYVLEDFKKVIDNKVTDWKDNKEWDKFLRPETLFCKKHFESYLNEKIITKKKEDWRLDEKEDI